MTAEQAAQRRGYAAKSELSLRAGLESFCRERWTDARIVHEIVMGEGRVRADVAAIGPAHIAAFEVKGEYDDTTRLMHQVGMYQLCVPEVWMVVPEKHGKDAQHINYLLPSVGLLMADGMGSRNWGDDEKPVTLKVWAEAKPRPPVLELTLRLLWAQEMRGACSALRIGHSQKSTREHMVKGLLQIEPDLLFAQICTQLRSRDALWRADEPIVQATEKQ